MNNLLFFQQILSLSQDLCQDLICVTFQDVILLTDLWNYGSGKHWFSFQIISAICMIYIFSIYILLHINVTEFSLNEYENKWCEKRGQNVYTYDEDCCENMIQ